MYYETSISARPEASALALNAALLANALVEKHGSISAALRYIHSSVEPGSTVWESHIAAREVLEGLRGKFQNA